MARGKKGTLGAPKDKRLSFDEFRTRHKAEFAEDENLLLAKALSSGGNKSVSLTSLSAFGPEYNAWFASPGYRLTNELRTYWRVRLLAAAARENSPEAFRDILESWLINLRIEAPSGVFISSRRAPGEPAKKPGRPISVKNQHIFTVWIKICQPSLFTNELAQVVFGPEFTQASGTSRRKLRDQCRHAVERHLERKIAELDKEIADTRRENGELQKEIGELKERIAQRKKQQPTELRST